MPGRSNVHVWSSRAVVCEPRLSKSPSPRERSAACGLDTFVEASDQTCSGIFLSRTTLTARCGTFRVELLFVLLMRPWATAVLTDCGLEPMATAQTWDEDHAQFAPTPTVRLTIPAGHNAPSYEDAETKSQKTLLPRTSKDKFEQVPLEPKWLEPKWLRTDCRPTDRSFDGFHLSGTTFSRERSLVMPFQHGSRSLMVSTRGLESLAMDGSYSRLRLWTTASSSRRGAMPHRIQQTLVSVRPAYPIHQLPNLDADPFRRTFVFRVLLLRRPLRRLAGVAVHFDAFGHRRSACAVSVVLGRVEERSSSGVQQVTLNVRVGHLDLPPPSDLKWSRIRCRQRATRHCSNYLPDQG